jgi:hypothetical protein
MTMLASTPYPTARQAIQACQEDEVAIRIDGMNLVLDRETAYELDAEGIEFAYASLQFDLGDANRLIFVSPFPL